MESYCNSNRRKLDPRGMRKYREGKKRDREVEERGIRKVR